MRRLLLGMMIIFGAVLLAACGGGAYDAAPATAEAPMATPAPVDGEWLGHGAGAQSNRLVDVSPESADFAFDFYADDAVAWSYGGAGYGAIAPIGAVLEAPAPRMLIQRATLDMTTKEFTATLVNLRDAAAAFGGYIESSNLSAYTPWHWDNDVRLGRNFWITIRVPVARFEEALRHVEGYGEVLALNQTTDDVTGQFADFQRRMEVRLVEEERLLELVGQATTLQNIFTLEDRLTQVRHHIEFYRGAMLGLGDQAAFSTITVNLWEILDEEEDDEEEEAGYTFGQRISNTFGASLDVVSAILQGFVVFMAGAIVPLLILGALAFIIIVIVKFFAKRAAARPPKPPKYLHYGPYNPMQPYNMSAPTPEAATETPKEASEAKTDEETGEES